MRGAVMQPYLFPYLGYIQLIKAVDLFVLYDDVQFIKQGYVNRNKMAFGPFVVPLRKGRHTTQIKDRVIDQTKFPFFRKKWLRSFDLTYGKSSLAEEARELALSSWNSESLYIARQCELGLINVSRYLGLETKFIRASELDYDREAGGEKRLLSLLRKTGIDNYVNSIGGKHLYNPETFATQGVNLCFVKSSFAQHLTEEEANYSILHLIARYDKGFIQKELLNAFKLIEKNE